MSKPEIAKFKKYPTENYLEPLCVKQTSKFYPLFINIQIVHGIERRKLRVITAPNHYEIQCIQTIINWLTKFSKYHCNNYTPSNITK